MTKARDDPYVWVTWITDLLAGEAQCQWAAWFRAHFQQYERQPSNFDQAAWNARHGEMVRARAAELRSAGYTVFIEDQNKFSLRGKVCTLGGKPDLVAVNADDALVIDCKTGQRREQTISKYSSTCWCFPFLTPCVKIVGFAASSVIKMGSFQYQQTS